MKGWNSRRRKFVTKKNIVPKFCPMVKSPYSMHSQLLKENAVRCWGTAQNNQEKQENKE